MHWPQTGKLGLLQSLTFAHSADFSLKSPVTITLLFPRPTLSFDARLVICSSCRTVRPLSLPIQSCSLSPLTQGQVWRQVAQRRLRSGRICQPLVRRKPEVGFGDDHQVYIIISNGLLHKIMCHPTIVKINLEYLGHLKLKLVSRLLFRYHYCPSSGLESGGYPSCGKCSGVGCGNPLPCVPLFHTWDKGSLYRAPCIWLSYAHSPSI